MYVKQRDKMIGFWWPKIKTKGKIERKVQMKAKDSG